MEAINQIVNACAWFPSKFFFFSENVFSPLVYYSHLFPAILSLVVGGILYFGNRKRLPNKILFITVILFSLWSLFDLVLWATPNPHDTVFFWTLVNMLEPLVYVSALCFLYAFVGGKMPSFRTQSIMAIIVLPALVFGPTIFNIAGLNFSNCDREAVEGALVYFNYIVEIIFSIWLVAYGLYKAHRAEFSDKKPILLCTAGLALFLFSFAFGNIIGSISENWIWGQVGIFGLPLLVIFLAVLVGKYQSFKTRAFSAEMLVIILWVLIVSMLFVTDIALLHIILGITLLATIILGISLIRSVRNQIRQKEKLGELNQKLTALDEKKDEFLSFAAHQIRSPLTSVKWGLNSIKEKYEPEIVKHLLETTDDLVSTVNDLLDISKIEQGGLVMKLEEFDLHDFVGRIVEEFRMTAENKGLKLAFTGDIASFFVEADQNKLRQVFVNLIDNAIKYTQKGEIKVVFRHRGKKAEVSVWDTGPGIAPEELENLFDKFLRGAAGKASQGGSGLGLYLAKKIVEAHKGKIWATSPGLNRGSTFSVELPPKS